MVWEQLARPRDLRSGLSGTGGRVNPASLPPGNPQLFTLMVEQLKSRGLLHSFRRHSLADVDTKPAYQNLRQKVDNFVSTHLDKQEWNPAMNKNQLRHGLKQSMVQSRHVGNRSRQDHFSGGGPQTKSHLRATDRASNPRAPGSPEKRSCASSPSRT
ncbi:Biorientation of chromosomes in cell division protein 1 [Cricetulus griseus]|uniref:Biorientation of chromosomes in cell division protein 1 n=1 Tax=Cricetulus griseus TaxID=10029 RepID=G3H7W3_CRIGR|nr:Biorientation of chromosomes in cell division protein 1 [Cricetulus griseus]ERE66761.1 biorientation of chromosomes in cell division protein 1 [Cricetulus griseus]